MNLAKPAKHAAYAGVGIIGIGATLVTGGGAGAVAAALGNAGLLGAAGTGTAIAGLNGAALTGASLAAIGGSVAAGTTIITASGSALGGVLANKFHGDDDSFAIRQLKSIPNSEEQTIFINGFTQKNEADFYDWQTEHLFAGFKHSTYGVNWDAKSNARLGAAFSEGATKKAALSMLAAISKRGGVQAAKQLSPLGWVTLMSDLVSNPWHSAMMRAAQAGAQLADCISRTEGQKFNLVGHSLGCRVIFYTLMALGTKSNKYINDVVLLGGAVGKDDKESWLNALSTIDGRLYNCYSKQDMILKRLYECVNAKLSEPIGYYPIPIEDERLVNIDCTDIVDSHMTWKKNFSTVLGLIEEHKPMLSAKHTNINRKVSVLLN
ncbi:hypothetical protein DA100_08095 [Vibrio sp. Hep-1b-8]|nr:hypothetical protein DA100_08095 [Vibrio sp. Hep-1b-8]